MKPETPLQLILIMLACLVGMIVLLLLDPDEFKSKPTVW